MGGSISTSKPPPAAGQSQKQYSKREIDEKVEEILKIIDYATDGSFPPEVEEEANAFRDWSPSAEELLGRRDFRASRRVFTIDPATARDLDDAVHVHALGDGLYELGVHIADVSHFVPAGGPMDREARRRATTIYLVDRSVPMLPRVLSEGVCSLAPNADRLAFSFTVPVDAEGRVAGEPWFGRSVIRSCVQLDYRTAQQLVDGEAVLAARHRPGGGHTVQQLADDLRLLHGITMARRRRRFDEEGALRMMRKSKFSFELSPETGAPVSMRLARLQDANRVVEEMMLLANTSVASHLVARGPGNALLRAHPPPRQKDLARFAASARERGFDVATGSSGALHKSLDAYRQSYTETGVNVRQLLEALFSKTMRGASYLCAGKIPDRPREWRHYALATDTYTHFTSPIRRYPDVTVHRQLDWLLRADGSPPMTADEVQEVCDHCNRRRDKAKQAQSEADRAWLAMTLERGDVYDLAAITNVSAGGGGGGEDGNGSGNVYVGVLVPRLGLRRSLRVSAFDGAVEADGERQQVTVTWAASGRKQTFGLFAALHVRLDVSRMSVGLRVVEEGGVSNF